MITDKMVNDGAIALAMSELTDHGRMAFDWQGMYSLSERQKYRAQASIVLHAALGETKDNVVVL